MPKKILTVGTLSQIPAAIKKLWGPPPILPSEDPEDYWKLAFAIAQDVEPASAIEWIYLKDIVVYTLELRRLHIYRASLIELEQGNRDDEEGNEEYMNRILVRPNCSSMSCPISRRSIVCWSASRLGGRDSFARSKDTGRALRPACRRRRKRSSMANAPQMIRSPEPRKTAAP